MTLQGGRVMPPLMLSLFLGATFSIRPLIPAENVKSSLANVTCAVFNTAATDGSFHFSFQLPLCQLINQTVSLEKEGCPKCHPVETTICSGHCITKDPVIKTPFSNVYQHVCTYRDFYYKTFELPDCPPGVHPTVTYPVALSCNCGRCAMDTSDCTFESLQPNFCMNDIPFYY